MQKNSHLRKLVFIALLTAQGIVLGLLEQAIPFPFAFAPGAKLGLANIVTLISLYTLSFKEVVFVIVMKTLLTTVLGGTVLLYLPAMSIVGIFAGIAVGVAANYALAHIKVLQYFSKK